MGSLHFVRTVYTTNAGLAGMEDHVPRDDKSHVTLIISCVIWVLAILIIGVRMYSRTILTNFYGGDDTWILAAMLFSTGDFIFKIIWCLHGLGVHIEQVAKSDFGMFAQTGYGISVIYPWSLGLSKLSILTFYRRVFPSTVFRQVCLCSMIFVAAMTISLSLAQAFSCTPASQSYQLQTIPGSHCINKSALQYSGNVLNLVTDFAVLLLPMKYLYALTLDKTKRTGIILLFSSGLMSCVASAVRMQTIWKFYNTQDPTYTAYPIAIASALETNLTIITASVAASKPALQKLVFVPLKRRFPGLFTTAPVTETGPSFIEDSANISLCHYKHASAYSNKIADSAYYSNAPPTPTTPVSEFKESQDFDQDLRNLMRESYGGGGFDGHKFSIKELMRETPIPSSGQRTSSIAHSHAHRSSIADSTARRSGEGGGDNRVATIHRGSILSRPSISNLQPPPRTSMNDERVSLQILDGGGGVGGAGGPSEHQGKASKGS